MLVRGTVVDLELREPSVSRVSQEVDLEQTVPAGRGEAVDLQLNGLQLPLVYLWPVACGLLPVAYDL